MMKIPTTLRRISPYYIGYPLFLAYSFFYVHDAAPLIGGAGMDQSYLVWYLGIMFAVKTFVFFACAAIAYKRPRFGGDTFAVPAAILLAVGLIFSIFLLRSHTLQFGESEAFVILLMSAVMLGIGDALTVLLWGRFSSTLSMRSTYLFVLSSYVLALALYMAIVNTPPVVLVICSLAGCMLLPFLWKKSMALRPVPEIKKPDNDTLKEGFSRIWRPVFLTAIFAFISNFTLLISGQQAVDTDAAHITSTIITLAVVLLMLLPVLLFPKLTNVGLVYRIALPLAAGGLLLLAFFWNSAGGVANSMVAMGWLLADLVSWCIIANAVSRMRTPAFILFGIGYSIINFASLIGLSGGFFFANAIGEETIALMTVALIATYLLSTILFFVVKDRRAFSLDDGAKKTLDVSSATQTSDGPGEDHANAEEPTYIVEDRVQMRVRQLSDQKNLTPRETDILGFLAQGRSTQYMAETLFLSENTVKSHVKNVYQKLGVHSKQDVIDIINSLE